MKILRRLIPLIGLLLASCSLIEAPKERSVTIKTPIVLKKQFIGKSYSYYKLDVGTRSMVWPEEGAAQNRLKKGKVYSIDLLEERQPSRLTAEDGFWSSEIAKIYDGADVIYDASICNLHNRVMDRVVVPISYGLYMYPPEYVEASNNLFRNIAISHGGCCDDGERKYTRTWVCEVCTSNKKEWDSQKNKKANKALHPTVNRP